MNQPVEGRSARKRRAILEAAEEVFLRGGYLGTNMDEIVARSEVSKQTVYKHFGSKENLFVEIVGHMTSGAGDLVHVEDPDLAPDGDLADYLCDYAYRQLTVVLTPRLMQLRRMVIGEVARFPELAETLYRNGPQRAIDNLAGIFDRLVAQGRLSVADTRAAASRFNWLVMSEPVNRAMLLGDQGIPGPEELRAHTVESVRVFLSAYGGLPGQERGAASS
ncbi:TetR/AcrR family transcriptional regulator [Nocardiopsis exhalans]|uniref:TetR/AcrR family transcriptional regulator n=1 Tax=Nocardiopsis exhalans TaxID=163604 RepID=A0ABY5DDF8_9ACTN|nr:TetR/AcrR family transcriptional regulator [Nocardiopsis exhalans]USY22369.1 TetR/AcrR family transcriptional regulator [Nocardiopsis exhalans]